MKSLDRDRAKAKTCKQRQWDCVMGFHDYPSHREAMIRSQAVS
jgi:hypothetical protein